MNHCLHPRRKAILSPAASCRRLVFSSSGVGPTREVLPGRNTDSGVVSGNRPSTTLSAVSAALKFSAESLFATLFPADCRICNELLVNISRLPVCESCKTRIKPFQSAQCGICGELVLSPRFAGFADEAPLQDAVCGLCQRARPSYVRAVACGPYEGVLRDLVHLLKYDRVESAAGILGKQLAMALVSVLAEVDDKAILVPVPLHATKLRQRGFNQAERIARATARCMGGAIELNTGILVRRRATESQTGLTRHQRRKNIRGAFEVKADRLRHMADKNIIIVDDVFTTGTTAEECARVLLGAGAKHVWIATVARVSKLEGVARIEGKNILKEEEAPQYV